MRHHDHNLKANLFSSTPFPHFFNICPSATTSATTFVPKYLNSLWSGCLVFTTAERYYSHQCSS